MTSSQIGNRYKTEQLEKVKQLNISPIVRRTPNTKADIIIQKIYTNRKNVIKNYQNTSTDFRDVRPSTNISSSIDQNLDKSHIYSNKIDNNSQNNDMLYNCENDTNLVNNDKNNLILSYTKPVVESYISKELHLSRIINKNKTIHQV